MVFLRLKRHVLRDRPCNLKGGGRVMVLCFVQIFFFGLHKSYNIYILCRAKCEIFFPEFIIRLYDKYSESNYFFFLLHQNQNIFFSNIGNQNILLEKKHKPPPSFKLNGCSLNSFIFSDYDSLRDVRKKTTEWLILIKKKYEINSLHVYSCYDFICKELFVVRLSKNQYKSTKYTHNSYNM